MDVNSVAHFENHVAQRLLDLLDYAYDAAEDPNGFDGLFSAADTFFFPESAMRGLADDIDAAQHVSAGLDRHVQRIQEMIDRAEVDQSGGARVSGGPQLANLVISADAKTIVGNTAAARLLGCSFPIHLDDLTITDLSKQTILKCLSELVSGQFEGSTVMTFQHVSEDRPYLAKCTKLQSRSAEGKLRRGLSMTINHIDWQEDALGYAAKTFDLTKAETDLLACLLIGMSYPQAAEKLCKSRETLKVQGKSILRKTGLTQVSDVVNFMTGYAYLAEPERQTKTTDVGPSQMQGAHLFVIASGGRKIQVNRFGLPGGRPLLFFHGLYQGPYLTDAMDQQFRALGYDVIAPSRPGFNRSDPPQDWAVFNATVTSDVLAVCEHFDVGRVSFIVHQAGISFACRAGQALGARVESAVMIGAGVPIKDYMLKTMNLEARVAGAAVKYAPKLLDMLLRVGIAKWRRQGAYAYLMNLFPDGLPDRETLHDPVAGPIMERGIHHMISQGPQTIHHDGLSAMSDWEAEYIHLPKRQLWLHGAHDMVMNPQFVQEFLATKNQPPAHVYPDRGGDVLLGAADDVIRKVHSFLTD